MRRISPCGSGSQPVAGSVGPEAAHEVSKQTYALTQAMGGSISAEHGIGLLKKPWLNRVRSERDHLLYAADWHSSTYGAEITD